MTTAKSESLQPARPALGTADSTARPGEGIARIRLYLGLAAIFALVVWGLLSGATAPEAPELRQDSSSSSPDPRSAQESRSAQEPRFDGRGKWSGYAR